MEPKSWQRMSIHSILEVSKGSVSEKTWVKLHQLEAAEYFGAHEKTLKWKKNWNHPFMSRQLQGKSSRKYSTGSLQKVVKDTITSQQADCCRHIIILFLSFSFLVWLSPPPTNFKWTTQLGSNYNSTTLRSPFPRRQRWLKRENYKWTPVNLLN